MIKSADELKQLVTRMLVAADADEANAGVVAEHLVAANLSGVDTHGVWQLPGYIAAIQAGELAAAARPEMVRETATSVLVTGNWTFGQVSAPATRKCAHVPSGSGRGFQFRMSCGRSWSTWQPRWGSPSTSRGTDETGSRMSYDGAP